MKPHRPRGDSPNAAPARPSAFPWRVLLLAAVGQLFMAQWDNPWTLFPGLLLFACALALFYPSLKDRERQPSPLPLRVEFFLLVFILWIASLFRVYGIDSMPSGMHTDQGLIGLSALRILHEGWRPFREVFDYQVPELLLFYQLAGWFWLVGSSYLHFHGFFILLSLAAFPFVYWTLRQWAGQRVALLSLFILAVMRWNWIETRNGYPSIQVPLYLFGALGFWTYWTRYGKNWALLLSALFVGVGFYSYQAYKIVPLLFAVYAAYEFFSQKKKNRSLKPFLPFFLVVFVIILPLLAVMVQKGILGHREADLFSGSEIIRQHSLRPLWDVWTGTLLMFNRTGDMNPRHNLPGHPMLDDVTAIFLVFGLALAWRRRKEREGFYPLAGFGVLLLTGLLSTDPAHSNRLVSLTPFAAYFAGNALSFWGDKARSLLRPSWTLGMALALVLGVMAYQNAQTYFVEQAENTQCQEAFGEEQTDIGRYIDDYSSFGSFQGDLYFVSPAYFKNLTVSYLSFRAGENVLEFNLQDWARGRFRKDEEANILLENEKSGIVEFLQAMVPHLEVEPQMDAHCKTVVYALRAQPSELSAVKPWNRGLEGVYRRSADWKAKPVAIQWDPVLNFTSKFDFPFTDSPPFRIRWTGTLEVPKTGGYQFQVITTDAAQLWLDGKPVALETPLSLAAGAHPLRLDFEKDAGDDLALTLIWKKPGDEKWEVVPALAFGKVRAQSH